LNKAYCWQRRKVSEEFAGYGEIHRDKFLTANSDMFQQKMLSTTEMPKMLIR
jgi:hypothetical protein